MIAAIFLILAGLFGLGLGGELLVRGAVAIAQKLGISNLLTGLVIVGFATSMPELVASVQAALSGAPGIAWGNVVGSNQANTLLILGATALVAPIVLTGMGRRDSLVALACTVALMALAYSGAGASWIGIAFLVLLITYIAWRYMVPGGGLAQEAEAMAEEDSAQMSTLLAIGFFISGLAALITGRQILVEGAINMARIVGLSETVIGLTVVAVGTSLPELAASIAAALRGKPGLAVGNVVGSNIYNILLIGGVTLLLAPAPLPLDLRAVQLPLLLLSALLLVLLLWRFHVISRLLGLLMLALYLGNVIVALS